jgi:hypothetical protein
LLGYCRLTKVKLMGCRRHRAGAHNSHVYFQQSKRQMPESHGHTYV